MSACHLNFSSLFALLFALTSLTAKAETVIYLHEGESATAALEKVNQASGAVRLVVEPGVYWIDDPDDPTDRVMPDHSTPFGFTIRCDSLTIVGTDPNPVNTVFASNRGQTRGAIGNFTMFHFLGHSLTVENITFGNYCNVDLDYPRTPALNRTKRAAAIVQAQLGICSGTDRVLARNCRFISRLNLCPFTGGRRSLFENCYFECTDDALAGSAVYLNSKFRFYSTKPFYSTSATGAVFLNCDIELLGGAPQYLSKAPGAAVLIDTRFTTPDGQPRDIRWYRDDAPKPCYYSNVTLNGQPYAMDASRPWLSVDITELPLLKAFKVGSEYNLANLMAGDDGWDPTGSTAKIPESCIGLPVAAIYSPNSQTISVFTSTLPAAPTLMRWGSYPVEATEEFEATLSPRVKSGKARPVISTQVQPEEKLLATNYPSGLRGLCFLTVEPLLAKFSGFASEPKLTVKDGTVAQIDYKLATDAKDRSEAIWYRAEKADLSDAVAIGKQAASVPFKARPAESGCYLFAEMLPMTYGEEDGEKLRTEAVKLGAISGEEEKELSTDFSNVHVAHQPQLKPGTWTFDAFKPADTEPHRWEPQPENAWYYGLGTDGATGVGLVQATKGARAFYVPARSGCEAMTATLSLEPCKPAGQGFGSATAQYLDIYVGFDPATMNGYALRIQRTVDYDRAVVFSLLKYENGVPSVISEPQASTCFRTPCKVDISVADGVLTAKASTGAVVDPQPGTLESVDLSAPVTAPISTAFGLQHTGSTGASATLISSVALSWR